MADVLLKKHLATGVWVRFFQLRGYDTKYQWKCYLISQVFGFFIKMAPQCEELALALVLNDLSLSKQDVGLESHQRALLIRLLSFPHKLHLPWFSAWTQKHSLFSPVSYHLVYSHYISLVHSGIPCKVLFSVLFLPCPAYLNSLPVPSDFSLCLSPDLLLFQLFVPCLLSRLRLWITLSK